MSANGHDEIYRTIASLSLSEKECLNRDFEDILKSAGCSLPVKTADLDDPYVLEPEIRSLVSRALDPKYFDRNVLNVINNYYNNPEDPSLMMSFTDQILYILDFFDMSDEVQDLIEENPDSIRSIIIDEFSLIDPVSLGLQPPEAQEQTEVPEEEQPASELPPENPDGGDELYEIGGKKYKTLYDIFVVETDEEGNPIIDVRVAKQFNSLIGGVVDNYSAQIDIGPEDAGKWALEILNGITDFKLSTYKRVNVRVQNTPEMDSATKEFEKEVTANLADYYILYSAQKDPSLTGGKPIRTREDFDQLLEKVKSKYGPQEEEFLKNFQDQADIYAMQNEARANEPEAGHRAYFCSTCKRFFPSSDVNFTPRKIPVRGLNGEVLTNDQGEIVFSDKRTPVMSAQETGCGPYMVEDNVTCNMVENLFYEAPKDTEGVKDILDLNSDLQLSYILNGEVVQRPPLQLGEGEKDAFPLKTNGLYVKNINENLQQLIDSGIFNEEELMQLINVTEGHLKGLAAYTTHPYGYPSSRPYRSVPDKPPAGEKIPSKKRKLLEEYEEMKQDTKILYGFYQRFAHHQLDNNEEYREILAGVPEDDIDRVRGNMANVLAARRWMSMSLNYPSVGYFREMWGDKAGPQSDNPKKAMEFEEQLKAAELMNRPTNIEKYNVLTDMIVDIIIRKRDELNLPELEDLSEAQEKDLKTTVFNEVLKGETVIYKTYGKQKDIELRLMAANTTSDSELARVIELVFDKVLTTPSTIEGGEPMLDIQGFEMALSPEELEQEYDPEFFDHAKKQNLVRNKGKKTAIPQIGWGEEARRAGLGAAYKRINTFPLYFDILNKMVTSPENVAARMASKMRLSYVEGDFPEVDSEGQPIVDENTGEQVVTNREFKMFEGLPLNDVASRRIFAAMSLGHYMSDRNKMPYALGWSMLQNAMFGYLPNRNDTGNFFGMTPAGAEKGTTPLGIEMMMAMDLNIDGKHLLRPEDQGGHGMYSPSDLYGYRGTALTPSGKEKMRRMKEEERGNRLERRKQKEEERQRIMEEKRRQKEEAKQKKSSSENWYKTSQADSQVNNDILNKEKKYNYVLLTSKYDMLKAAKNAVISSYGEHKKKSLPTMVKVPFSQFGSIENVTRFSADPNSDFEAIAISEELEVFLKEMGMW